MKTELFETSDFPLITALSLEFPIEKTALSYEGRVCFYFTHSPQLEKFVREYWNGEKKVSPLLFYQQMKMIRGRIFDVKNTIIREKQKSSGTIESNSTIVG